jgi:hypothetical protein
MTADQTTSKIIYALRPGAKKAKKVKPFQARPQHLSVCNLCFHWSATSGHDRLYLEVDKVGIVIRELYQVGWTCSTKVPIPHVPRSSQKAEHELVRPFYLVRSGSKAFYEQHPWIGGLPPLKT